MAGHNKSLMEARILSEEIASSLPNKIQIASLTLKSKIPFKALSIRELLIHRLSALAINAVELLEKGHVVSGVVLTRSVVETVAVLYVLHERIFRYLENNNLKDFDDFLMRCLLGSRNKTGKREAINILNAIDRVDKKHSGFRIAYDGLCEYTHPNWAGTMGAYGKIDKMKFELKLGGRDRTKAKMKGSLALVVSLLMFKEYYNSMTDLMFQLNNHFENK